MIVESGNRLVESLIKRSLLRGSKDGKRTATSCRMSSLESGGSEYFHEELKKQEREQYHLYTQGNGEHQTQEQLGTVDFLEGGEIVCRSQKNKNKYIDKQGKGIQKYKMSNLLRRC